MQVVTKKTTREIICVAFSEGKKHDFQLFKDSRLPLQPTTFVTTDTGYIGLAKLHANCLMPKKKSKHHPLSKSDKRHNREISIFRVSAEHVFSRLKRFEILGGVYRGCLKRFELRFKLIAGIYNYELRN